MLLHLITSFAEIMSGNSHSTAFLEHHGVTLNNTELNKTYTQLHKVYKQHKTVQ